MPLELSTPIGPLLLGNALTCTEGISTLGEIEVEFLSEQPDIMPDELLGRPVTAVMTWGEDKTRRFSGICTRFGIAPGSGKYYGYRATLRPWLWLLTRTADCKIYSGTVPEIVKQVFETYAFARYRFDLIRTNYRKREYCVQYRETAYNFVARLLEDEGIYWYFQHVEGGVGEHEMVLLDMASRHEIAPGLEPLPYYGKTESVPPQLEYIGSWTSSAGIQAGIAELTSYNFERPTELLHEMSQAQRKHELADFMQFDFQGDWVDVRDGRDLVNTRLEEIQSRHHRYSGTTTSPDLVVGHLFEMERHPRPEENGKYFCVSQRVSCRVNGRESGNPSSDFHCSFTALPADQAFRPERRTPKPFVQGPQTAVVVGADGKPSGDGILTDKYGRVRVRFHWAHRYNYDEMSWWIRVSSPWAGKNFGHIQVPRIGQEVIVDFLEGDPDQPIITGRVYNAEQMPPWTLPDNASQSGVLSRSLPGGAYENANALRFEDKKGEEELWLHAERNQRIEVEADESHWVGHDRKKTIDHDETVEVKNNRTEKVGVNEKITIGSNRTEDVGANEDIKIGANRTEQVGTNERVTIGVNRDLTVGANETINVAANRTETIGASLMQTIGASSTQTIGATSMITVASSLTQTVGGAVTMISGGPTTIIASGGMNIIAPGGTKVIDFELCQIGGTIKEGYASKLDFNILAMEVNAVKGEATGSSNAVVGMKAEKVGFEVGQTDMTTKMIALEALSSATSIEMDTLKVLF